MGRYIHKEEFQIGTLQTIIYFLLVLSILVFVHELGHFLFAKRAGMLVRQFAIGFGPKIFSFKKGETLYSFRLFPLGGFVLPAGEDGETINPQPGETVYLTQNSKNEIDNIYLYEPDKKNFIKGNLISIDTVDSLEIVIEKDDKTNQSFNLSKTAFVFNKKTDHLQIAPRDRQYGTKTVGQRALMTFGGPLFNIILTLVLFVIIAVSQGIPNKVNVKEVISNSPSQLAGFKAGDAIDTFNGQKINSINDINKAIFKSKDNPSDVVLIRDGKKFNTTVTPRKNQQVYIIGTQLQQTYDKNSILASSVHGVKQTFVFSVETVKGLWSLITGEVSVKQVTGPIGIAQYTGNAASKGLLSLMSFTAFLSLNLAIFNLLPIPGLDGSRLLFLSIEAIRRKPLNAKVEGTVHIIGFALLILLMVFVMFNDIVKVFGLGS